MTPELRLAVLEWARRQAAGELPGLDWVEATILEGGAPFTVVRTDEGVRFRHVPYGHFLPPPMVDAAASAQGAGEVPALELLLQVFARAEWMVAAREHFWSPYSPIPALLASLVEAYGVDVEIHRSEPETLSRAIAHLPTWYPHRGDPERAAWLMEVALRRPVPVSLDQGSEGAREEVFACRQASWFAQREVPDQLVVRDGLTRARYASPGHNAQDVLVGWVPGDRFPHHLLRLLPVWSSLRLHRESHG